MASRLFRSILLTLLAMFLISSASGKTLVKRHSHDSSENGEDKSKDVPPDIKKEESDSTEEVPKNSGEEIAKAFVEELSKSSDEELPKDSDEEPPKTSDEAVPKVSDGEEVKESDEEDFASRVIPGVEYAHNSSADDDDGSDEDDEDEEEEEGDDKEPSPEEIDHFHHPFHGGFLFDLPFFSKIHQLDSHFEKFKHFTSPKASVSDGDDDYEKIDDFHRPFQRFSFDKPHFSKGHHVKSSYRYFESYKRPKFEYHQENQNWGSYGHYPPIGTNFGYPQEYGNYRNYRNTNWGPYNDLAYPPIGTNFDVNNRARNWSSYSGLAFPPIGPMHYRKRK